MPRHELSTCNANAPQTDENDSSFFVIQRAIEKQERLMTKRKSALTTAGHRRRLREKFLRSGLSGFHDYEIVELLLTLATPRKDCKQQAKAALKRFKTLQGVIQAPVNELTKIEGIGPRNLFGIKFVYAVAKRYREKKLINKNPITSSKELFDFLFHSLRDKDREVFMVVFLDAQNRVITVETIFQGTLTSSAVYPREVVLAALRHKAAGLFLVHNHPSGDPRPSQQDETVTRQMVYACRVMGITVHEHIVIGDNTYYSFADHGRIANINRDHDRNHLA